MILVQRDVLCVTQLAVGFGLALEFALEVLDDVAREVIFLGAFDGDRPGSRSLRS